MMRRWLTPLIALLLVASACSSDSGEEITEPQSGNYGSGVDLDFDDDGHPVPATDGTSSDGGTDPGTVGDAPPPRQTPSDFGGGGDPTVGRRPFDDGRTGENAFFYLNEQVPKLILEIDMMEGLELQASTIDLLESRLSSVADKPQGIEVVTETVPRSDRAEWDMDAIRAHEQEHRDHRSSADQVVLYVHVIGGDPAGDSGAIGIAYSSSSFVIFLERIRNAAATPLVSAQQIERATSVHEMGHLLALVNLTYTSPRPHEDSEHQGHSNNSDSVMYWAVDNVGVAGLLEGRTEPATDFDADDRADLADIKAGKLG